MNNSTETTPDTSAGISLSQRALHVCGWLVGGIVWAWSACYAFFLDDQFGQFVGLLLGSLIAVGVPLVAWYFRNRKTVVIGVVLAMFLICLVGYFCIPPSHDRDWGMPQSKLPQAVFNEDLTSVTIKNIRSLRYGPAAPGKSHFDDRYDLSKVKSVWFGVDRFTDFQPVAHTFLSFEFEPGDHRNNFLAFSVETRREKDEQLYSPLRGIFNNYETIYVIADEQDVLSVRSDVRQNVVQLYPIRATREQAREMFVDLLKRAEAIRNQPEFYNTISNNCTNNIVSHANKVLDQPISTWQRGVVFPGYSDWLAYQYGMIDTELSLEEAREAFRIDDRVTTYSGEGDFSEFIRGRDSSQARPSQARPSQARPSQAKTPRASSKTVDQ